MNAEATPVVMLAALALLSVSWALLLTAGVRLRGRAVPGRRWLTAAGAVGAAGAVAGAGLFLLIGVAGDDPLVDLVQALLLFLPASQLAALLCAGWGLRRAWRAAEGWDGGYTAAPDPSPADADVFTS